MTPRTRAALAALATATVLGTAPAIAEDSSDAVTTPPASAEAPADSSPLVPGDSGGTEGLTDPSDGERAVAVDFDASVASKYLFQGADLSQGNPVFQPALAFTANDVSVGAWLNFDLDTGVVDEVDLTLQYAWSVDRVTVAPGYAYLSYPHRGWDPSQELLVDVSYASILSPTLSVHYDFDAGQGTYTTLGVSHELPTGVLPVGLGLNLYYQQDYYDATGVPALEVSTSTAYAVGASTIGASLSYVPTWENGDFRDDAAVPSGWLFSLNVAQSF
jgi:hypothetical protein